MEFVEYAGQFTPVNVHRTSVALALGLPQIKATVVAYESLPREHLLRKCINDQKIWRLIERYLPDKLAAIEEKVNRYEARVHLV